MAKELSRRETQRRLREYREWMLQNKTIPYVLDKIFEAALDDDHKNQAVAWKIVADRVLPVAGFSAEQKSNAAVQINITGLGEKTVDVKDIGSSEDITGEYQDVSEDDN